MDKLNELMTFDEIVPDLIYAVRLDGKDDNEFSNLFENLFNPFFVYTFLKKHETQLYNHFKVIVSQAAIDVQEDAEHLEDMFDEYNDTNFDQLFIPLSNKELFTSELQLTKARRNNRKKHASWLRIYAIRLETGIFIVTGGAIKLYRKMQDEESTNNELKKLKEVKKFLKDNDVIDYEDFINNDNIAIN